MILQFFSPLSGTLRPTSNQDDLMDQYPMDRGTLYEFYTEIRDEMEQYSKALGDSGLMKYYFENDDISGYVKKAIPSIQSLEWNVYSVITVEIDDNFMLNKEHINILKNFFVEQYINDWGRKFEEFNIEVLWENPKKFEDYIGSILNVRFWDYKDFFIKTKREINREIYVRNNIRELKMNYPEGTEVELLNGVIEEDLSKGLKGNVRFIDYLGEIYVEWEDGRLIPIIEEEDSFKKVTLVNEEKLIMEF